MKYPCPARRSGTYARDATAGTIGVTAGRRKTQDATGRPATARRPASCREAGSAVRAGITHPRGGGQGTAFLGMTWRPGGTTIPHKDPKAPRRAGCAQGHHVTGRAGARRTTRDRAAEAPGGAYHRRVLACGAPRLINGHARAGVRDGPPRSARTRSDPAARDGWGGQHLNEARRPYRPRARGGASCDAAPWWDCRSPHDPCGLRPRRAPGTRFCSRQPHRTWSTRPGVARSPSRSALPHSVPVAILGSRRIDRPSPACGHR